MGKFEHSNKLFIYFFIAILLPIYYCESHNLLNKYQCHQRRFPNSDSFVCVCNGTHCDQPKPFDGNLLIGSDEAIVYVTDRDKYRLNQCMVPIKTAEGGPKRANSTGRHQHIPKCEKEKGQAEPKSWLHIKVNASHVFQKVQGFGGSFTDSAGYNVQKLSSATQHTLLSTYFGREAGIGYSLCRVPMGGADFSVRAYSYAETPNDFELKKFALAKEDLEWKIPYIVEAQKLSGQRLQLIASPWSPPGWMKSNGHTIGFGTMKGTLRGPYYQSFARYFIRFFEEYQKHNVTFWGCTLLNEPFVGAKPGMYMNATTQREWATEVLAPTLKQSKFKDTVLMAHDDNRNNVLESAIEIFGNQTDSPISGLTFHWYSFGYYDNLSRIHSMFPNKFLIGAEASAGFEGAQKGVSLGNWDRAVQYGRDIIGDLQNWATGWIDWNLFLNQNGGPNFVNNFIDAAIIVNAKNDEFYKQPTFYAVAHFSRFIPPQSERIDATFETPTLLEYFPAVSLYFPSPNPVDFVAFQTPPHGNRVMVLLSNRDETIGVTIHDGFRSIDVTIPPRAIVTVLWGK
ncbi:hypothetical protein GPALN_005087 [Globodera pallida]|nr:hypothetical protein GPALN_005087 [Globodera pallida]